MGGSPDYTDYESIALTQGVRADKRTKELKALQKQFKLLKRQNEILVAREKELKKKVAKPVRCAVEALTIPQAAILGLCRKHAYYNAHMKGWNRGVLDELKDDGLVTITEGRETVSARLTDFGAAVLTVVQNG